MFRILAVPAIVLVSAGAVSAEDWAGAYVGGQIGSLNADSTASSSETELSYGIHGGYLAELGNNFVVGGEVEYDATDMTLGGIDVDSIARAKLIAGYDAGAFMPYAVVGGARADTSAGNENGWVAGAGVAYQLNSNLRLSGEILYQEFDGVAGSSIDADATSANVRVSYRF